MSDERAPRVDVLIPTCNRPVALAVTLAGLLGQDLLPERIVVSDQTEGDDPRRCAELAAVLGVWESRARPVAWHRHLPRRGLAEQRDFLLGRGRAPYVLFLDDDVIVEPDVLGRLARTLRAEGCGFVGMPLVGPSYRQERRPHQQSVTPWEGPVEPEVVLPGTAEWERHHLHSAANALHAAERLGLRSGDTFRYKVAWIGGCVLYDTAKLRATGGFGFWRRLPATHAGEDVLAQLRVMARFGGCGILPSGAYHQELPTTVPDRRFDAPRDAPDLLPSAPAAGAPAPAARSAPAETVAAPAAGQPFGSTESPRVGAGRAG